MTTKIGLIADVHASVAPLREALDIFSDEGVSHILCVGDIAGYGEELAETVSLLQASDCVVLAGNHEFWYIDRLPENSENHISNYFSDLPKVWEAEIEGVALYAVHASPPVSLDKGIKLLDENGSVLPREKKMWEQQIAGYSFDVLIVGHTHQVFSEWLGGKLVINPGSTKLNHSCAILSVPEKNVGLFSLSGKQILKSWNWGMITRA